MHNPMFDEKGRVWFTSVIRPPDNPAYCKEGSSHPSAKLFPLTNSGRQLAFFDPKSKEFTLIDTCFSTHHLQFAEDANQTLWTSSGGGGGAVGWINRKMFEETHDEQKSQGWTALILDTNGNGKRDRVRRAEPAGRPRQGQAHHWRILRRDGEPGGRLGLGVGAGIPGIHRAAESGKQPAGDRALGNLRTALEQSEGEGAGLLAARPGYRHATAWCGR